MFCGPNSFGKYLGFIQEKYESSTSYIAEELPELNLNEIFIFFPNLDKSNPIFSINQDQEIKLLKNLQTISNLKSLIVQFKKSLNPTKKDFITFNEKPQIDLEISY